MSGRFVRASKFRNVYGDPPKLQKCFQELRPQTAGESNYIAANRKYFAIGVLGGGGPLLVHPLNDPKRFPAKFPVVNVHKGKILDIDFNPFYDDLVGMCSDDGTASMVRIPEEFEENIREPLVTLVGHQKRVGVMKFNKAAADIVATGSYDNTVKIWDVVAQAEVLTYDAFEDFIQCIAWNNTGDRLCVTSKDKKVRVYDPRSAEEAVCIDGYSGAKSSRAVWADSQEKLVVTGFTRQATRCIGFYDPRNMDEKFEDIELDQSAGVLLPFWDEDCGMLYITGKGDGGIRYYEINGEDPYIHHLSDFRSNVPHKGVTFAPKAACDYMSCEIGYCLRLQKNLVEPIHFVAPRKSELFQADLFPDTYAGVAAVTSAEWLEGASGEPPKVSIQEAAAGNGNAEFVAKKSPAELEKELAEALERIQELEAQLAALQG